MDTLEIAIRILDVLQTLRHIIVKMLKIINGILKAAGGAQQEGGAQDLQRSSSKHDS